MYMILIKLDPTHRRTKEELADVYKLHQSIPNMFPGGAIYRVDGGVSMPSILAVSSKAPDEKYLTSKGWLADDDPIKYQEYDIKPRAGLTLQFRLTANPSKRDRNLNKRIGLYKYDEQRDWLIKAGLRSGFAIDRCDILFQERAVGMKGSGYIDVLRVGYDGTLTVTDDELFHKALMEGIGHAKAWGCGLLTVRP